MRQKLLIHFLERSDPRWNDAQRRMIRDVLQKTWRQAAAVLPLPSVMNVTVFASDLYCVPETGEGGYTVTKDWIQLYLDPAEAKRWPGIIRRILPSTFFHELHHASRHFQTGPRTTLADDVLTEGLATVFASERFPSFVPPWGQATEAQAARWLNWMKPDWNKRHYSRHAYFFSSGPNRWAGYRLGTRLVERAKERTGATAAEMVAWNARRILRAADAR